MAKRIRAEVRNAVHRRIRRKVRGTTERPRLAVYRSLNHIYAQVIDDVESRTIVAASTTEKSLGAKTGGNIEAAKLIGQTIAERALAAGVERVVFDRGGYLYHGRVKALTDAARAAGLNKDEVREPEAAVEEPLAAEPEAAEAKPKKKRAKAPKEEEAAKAPAAEPSAQVKEESSAQAKEEPSAQAKEEPSAQATAEPSAQAKEE